MPKWIWIAVLPVLAAVLVFMPALLAGDTPTESPRTKTESTLAARSDAAGTKRLSKSSTSSSGLPSAWQLGTSLIFVLVLALAAVLVVRRLQEGGSPTRSDAKIEVRESRRLGKGRAIHFVRVDEHLLLLGESETGVTLLQDLTPRVGQELSQVHGMGLDVSDGDGATPRDLLPPSARRATTRSDKLGDFRALLGKLA